MRVQQYETVRDSRCACCFFDQARPRCSDITQGAQVTLVRIYGPIHARSMGRSPPLAACRGRYAGTPTAAVLSPSSSRLCWRYQPTHGTLFGKTPPFLPYSRALNPTEIVETWDVRNYCMGAHVKVAVAFGETLVSWRCLATKCTTSFWN